MNCAEGSGLSCCLHALRPVLHQKGLPPTPSIQLNAL
jgi:hypothetical protein